MKIDMNDLYLKGAAIKKGDRLYYVSDIHPDGLFEVVAKQDYVDDEVMIHVEPVEPQDCIKGTLYASTKHALHALRDAA